MTNNGKVRYVFKTPYRDGTTHVLFEPLDFMARLAALIPKPRINLTRLHSEHPCSSPYRQAELAQIHYKAQGMPGKVLSACNKSAELKPGFNKAQGCIREVSEMIREKRGRYLKLNGNAKKL